MELYWVALSLTCGTHKHHPTMVVCRNGYPSHPQIGEYGHLPQPNPSLVLVGALIHSCIGVILPWADSQAAPSWPKTASCRSAWHSVHFETCSRSCFCRQRGYQGKELERSSHGFSFGVTASWCGGMTPLGKSTVGTNSHWKLVQLVLSFVEKIWVKSTNHSNIF